jgi:hypothetical protein
MAIEVLKGIESIGGYKLAEVDDPDLEKHEEFIVIDHGRRTICFTIQSGPPKEVGVNGCRVETILEVVRSIVHGLNCKVSCRENEEALTKIGETIEWLEKRAKDRKRRGVEGTSSF